MRVSIERLRRWIILAAVILVTVLAGFFFYARLQLRRVTRDLPGRLGVNIQQTAKGFTYSKSEKGHTLFTIQASKLVQFKGRGRAQLQDVSITLYGPEGSGRNDRISGSEFDYDPAAGLASAQGAVSIDLAGPEPQANSSIHVKTSGLTFNQKTGEATTAQLVEFAFPKASGKATGASYNEKTGLLVMDHDVELQTHTQAGGDATVHAQHAQLLRSRLQAYLVAPRVDYENGTSTADEAVVSFRKDGSAERIVSRGHVDLSTKTGSQLHSGAMVVSLNEHSQPLQADLSQRVNFSSLEEAYGRAKHGGISTARRMNGVATQGTLLFQPGPGGSSLSHATFRNAVSFVEQVRGLAGDPAGTATRELTGSQIELDFKPAGRGAQAEDGDRVEALSARLSGQARLLLRVLGKSGKRATTATADRLIAQFAPGNVLRQLDGEGNTRLADEATDGSSSTSSGDTLHATFTSDNASLGSRAKDTDTATGLTVALDTAVQQGHAVLTDKPAPKGANASSDILRATGDRAEYHASSQLLTLTGSPRILDASLDLTASEVQMHRDTGQAVAKGPVRATYFNSDKAKPAASFGGNGPVHIVASSARFVREVAKPLNGNASNTKPGESTTVFEGSASSPARLWQGADSVSAPRIEIEQGGSSLRAGGGKVNTVFTRGPGKKQTSAGSSVLRVESAGLYYQGARHRADFSGGVVVREQDATLHADAARVFLVPAEPAPKGQAATTNAMQDQPAQSSAGQVDRIIAEGRVRLTQPGRSGEGERLLYTAQDGQYVLTGTTARPPRIVDAVRGTVTGERLIFNSQDDSVTVSGGPSSAVTETRVPK